MRKLISLCCTVIVLCVGYATADTVIPKYFIAAPKYSINDFWTYSQYMSPDNHTIAVAGTDVTVRNSTCYEMHYVSRVGGPPALVDWYRVSDHALVASNEPGSNCTMYYEPPYRELDFPLFVGKAWSSIFTRIRCDDDGNRTVEANWTDYFHVDAEEDIIVTAGTFHCLRIAEQMDPQPSSRYFYRWYSPKAGAYVKSGNFSELLAYSFKAGNITHDDSAIVRNASIVLSFAFILFAIDVVVPIILIVKNRKRTGHRKSPPPHGS